VAIGLAALVAVLVIAVILIVQTDWFRNYVRQTIISATEEGTGGEAEIGSFTFDWRKLEAIVTDFVIHGKEPQGAKPFARVARVQVNLRLFTSFEHLLDVTFLGIEQPQVNVMVFDDGTTNIPQPKDKKPESDKTILDTVVDLAVGHFRVTDGLLLFNSQPQKIDLQGNNLRAQLWFNLVNQNYKGEVSLQPLYVTSGKNTPVVFTITLPVILERNGIAFENAKITTPLSSLIINGALQDLKNPKTKLRINGHLALPDLKNLGDLPLDVNAGGIPTVAQVNGNVTMADNRITVDGLRVGLGNSNIEASGTLKDPQGNGALEFQARLALDEVGRVAKLTARPGGVVVANGTAKLDASNNYQITGTVQGNDLSFVQDGQRVRNIDVNTAVNINSKRIELNGMRLSAFGGQFTGDASLEDQAEFALNGTVRNFDLQAAQRALGRQPLPYDGVVSGPIQARGNLKAPGAKDLTATARLTIAPGRRGVPISGRINAEYSAATNNVNLKDSYIALPNTRLNLSGSLNNRVAIDMTTRNLNDLLAAIPGEKPDIALAGGEARFIGTMTGGVGSPRVNGHLSVGPFAVQGRRFDSLAVDVAAAPNRASLSNGLLQRGPMQADFNVSAGLQNWSAKPNQPLSAAVNVRNGDLADVMVLAGQPPAGYSGALAMTAKIGGTIGNPTGGADLQVLNGTVKDEPFDRIQARVNLADQLVTIPSAFLQAGQAQLNLNAEFRHPRDSFTTGQLRARVQSNQIELANIRNLQKQRPNTLGRVNVDLDIAGNLIPTKTDGKETSEFLLTSVNGNIAARDLRFDGQTYGDFTARASTTGQTVNYDVASNFAGSNIKVNGATQLVRDYPTTASANIDNLPIERLLVLARRGDIPARGIMSGTAHVSGTMANPQGTVDLNLAKAVVYGEPLDRIRAQVNYHPDRVDVPLLEVVSGPSRIDLTARYDHPVNNLNAGELQFKINSSRIELARIQNVQKARPGLEGILEIAAAGAASVREREPKLLFRDLNADIAATNIAANGRNFGDIKLNAKTTAGRVNFALDSNLAGSTIQGRGNAQLSGDFPVTAELNFKNVLWTGLQPLLGQTSGQPPMFEVATDGQVSVSGPATKVEAMRGALRVARLQFSTRPRPGGVQRPVTIRNEGPIVASLDRGVVRIDSAHLVGPQTDIHATGTVGVLNAQTMALNVSAKTNLELLESFSRDIYASGMVALNGTVRGTMAKPLVTGQLEVQNASFNHTSVPNGLSNANGLIVLSGNTATIRNLTGESGGGKVALSGFATYSDTFRLGLRATATDVRVRTQQGVSIVASSTVNVTGTSEASLAAGTITINRITYAPQSDMGSILTGAAPPVQAPEAPNPLLQNMRLDIRVRTTPSTAVQASLAQNVQLNADLRVRGTAARPGVLGRIAITEGDLVFFGSQYRVSSGTIAFYNPARIEPILNISLETQARGVNVVLNVTGPVNNMKLSYTSDPPLQFQEIVQLLASGRTPTSDPTLLANQPSQPQQSFQQMGQTAIVSKALADPVANRLERVFGVSQLKIDPTFTSGSDLPQARVTLQQQIAQNLTFTYVTALEDPNTQIVRIEWSFNPRWSAIANRDENGIFSINFLYKRQFR
jgi:translocation and assembly module TamB